MAEWIVERGIGEDRAALIDGDQILAAEIVLQDALHVDAVVAGRLIAADRGRGIVSTDAGEVGLASIPTGLSIGRGLNVRIIREAIPEAGRLKSARGMVVEDGPRPAPSLADRLSATGAPVREIAMHQDDLLETAGWSELLEEAVTGEIGFPGGSLRLSPTPAMTLFDVDGAGDVAVLAEAAAVAVALAISRHRIGGSIGVDFPTVAGKAARQAIAAAIDTHLPPPFERTAVNGFGFLQIVRPRARASLPELLRSDPVGAAARAALRRLERVPPGDPNRHRLPPAILAAIEARPDWMAELVRRTGRVPTFDR